MALVWGLYLLAVLTVGRFPEWTQPTIWYGGAFVGFVTVVEWRRSSGRLLLEVKLLTAFLLVGVAGYWVLVDESAYLETFKLTMEFVALVALVGMTVARAGSARWLWLAFVLATCFNLREEVVNPQQDRAPVVVGMSDRVQERAEGRTGNANALGFIAFAGAFGTLALLPVGGRRSWWPALAVAGALCVYTLLLSASRGAFVALTLGVFLWAVRCLPIVIGRKTGRSVFVAATLVLSLYAVRVALERTYLGARMTSGVAGQDESANARGDLFLAAFRLLSDSPVIGVGLGQFPVASGIGYYAHNELAELLGTTGLFGTGLFYAMYLASLRGLFRIERTRLSLERIYDLEITRILLIVLIVSGLLFRPNFLSIDSMFLIAMAVGSRHGIEASRRPRETRPLPDWQNGPRLRETGAESTDGDQIVRRDSGAGPE